MTNSASGVAIGVVDFVKPLQPDTELRKMAQHAKGRNKEEQ